MAALGLHYYTWAFSSWDKQGLLSAVVLGLLLLRSTGSRARGLKLLRGTWNLLRPEIEPVSPALAGRFFTTEPPGKPMLVFYIDSGFTQT